MTRQSPHNDAASVALLVQFLNRSVPDMPAPKVGYDHMGMVVVDAAFQQQASYRHLVLPRVLKLKELLPAGSTHAFVQWLESHDAAKELNYNHPFKIQLLGDIAAVFTKWQIDSTDDLRSVLEGPERVQLRRELLAIDHVGPKTRDYFDILVGIEEGAAVDSRVRRVLRQSGIDTEHLSYDDARAIMAGAATELGWPLGSVDSAIWGLGH